MTRSPPGWLWAAVIAFGLGPQPSAGADLGGVGEIFGNVTNLVWRARDSSSHISTSVISRLRLELDGARRLDGGDLSWRVAYDNEVIAGGLVEGPDFAAVKTAIEPTHFDGVRDLATGGSYLWRHRIARASLAWETDDWRGIAGRQRIAWGSGRIWNPTDRFNPTSATALESGQKTGSDALFAERYVGPFGALQMVAAPGRAKRNVSRKLALRWRDTIRESDYAVLVGAIEKEPIAGLDVSANLFGGGLHMEATAGWPRNAPRYAQMSLGYDVTVPAGFLEQPLSMSAEYFRNGAATGNIPIGLAPDRVNSRRRDLWGLSAGYDLSFLWRASATALFDTQTGSRVVIPSLNWSVSQDVDVQFSGQFFSGGAESEYGAGQDTFLVRVALYF